MRVQACLTPPSRPPPSSPPPSHAPGPLHPGLRDAAGQRLLSQLAALPNVHLAASVDHANAALLWDLQTRDRFGWAWVPATTYARYAREVAHAAVPSLLVGRGDEASRHSARVVLASLSASAREVWRLLAEQQLDPAAEEQGEGSGRRLGQRQGLGGREGGREGGEQVVRAGAQPSTRSAAPCSPTCPPARLPTHMPACLPAHPLTCPPTRCPPGRRLLPAPLHTLPRALPCVQRDAAQGLSPRVQGPRPGGHAPRRRRRRAPARAAARGGAARGGRSAGGARAVWGLASASAVGGVCVCLCVRACAHVCRWTRACPQGPAFPLPPPGAGGIGCDGLSERHARLPGCLPALPLSRLAITCFAMAKCLALHHRGGRGGGGYVHATSA